MLFLNACRTETWNPKPAPFSVVPGTVPSALQVSCLSACSQHERLQVSTSMSALVAADALWLALAHKLQKLMCGLVHHP